MLFDRICRENGVRHLLTAPHCPTTTGKVERFHKTVRAEFLSSRIFASIEEAQEELDTWVKSYNEERPHQGIGMVPPAKRFALARKEPVEIAGIGIPAEEPVKPEPSLRVTRRVSEKGKISLANTPYHVGRWLAGETVEITSDDRLVEIFHRGVLVDTYARRHPPDKVLAPRPRRIQARHKEPQAAGMSVVRLVDVWGDVSFAGTGYHVGKAHRGKEVEVRLVGDTVQIYLAGTLIRTHEARHDKSKEFGAFATPKGRHKKNKAS